MTSPATVKGVTRGAVEVVWVPAPRSWRRTLTKSMGWIMVVAMQPEVPPMRKGRIVVKREDGGVDVRFWVGELGEAFEAAMMVCLVSKSGGWHGYQAS